MKSLPNLFVEMSKKGFDWGLGERERGSLWAPHPISSLLSYTEKYNGEKCNLFKGDQIANHDSLGVRAEV